MNTIPSYRIAYKDQTPFMKILARLMFLNPRFMTEYVTTIGTTVYFPSRIYTRVHPVSSKLVLCHELVHIKDAELLTMPLFVILYMLPQLLVLAAIPLFFFHWWASLICLLFLAPIPAFFRMYFELKAYTFSVYAIYRLNQISRLNIKYNTCIDFYASEFSGPGYYYMWPFTGPTNRFNAALEQFQLGRKPYYSIEYYDMIDTILASNVKL